MKNDQVEFKHLIYVSLNFPGGSGIFVVNTTSIAGGRKSRVQFTMAIRVVFIPKFHSRHTISISPQAVKWLCAFCAGNETRMVILSLLLLLSLSVTAVVGKMVMLECTLLTLATSNLNSES